MPKIQLSDHFTYPRLLRFVYPSIVTMIFTSIYGVVDGLFVSNVVGATEFASLNLVMPYLMILYGIGFMIATGGTALVASELGAGEKKRAEAHFSGLVLFTLLFGIVLGIIGVFTVRPVSRLLGATDEMIEHCTTYGRVCSYFVAPFMLQCVFHHFLTAAEKPRLGLYITIAAGLTNAALDFLFIYVFRWGLTGAALATGLGQCVGTVLPLIYFLRPNESLLQLQKPKLELQPILRACGNGSSELMSNISSSIVGMLFNYQLIRLLGENGVSAYGVIMYIQFIFVAIYIGYSIGSAPIISFHYGAGNHGELQNMLRKSVILNFACGALLTVLAQILAPTFASIFVGYDKELCDLTIKAFRIFSLCFLFAGFDIFVSGFFTALNNGLVSAAISFLRTLLFETGCVIFLPMLVGVDGIWWSVAVADLFALILSAVFLFTNRKKYRYF